MKTLSLDNRGINASSHRLPRKVERQCPRCGRRAYHWLTHHDKLSTIKYSKLHTATCVNCGHAWPCRIMAKDL